MSLSSKMPLQVWILTLAAFAIGTAEFVIAGNLTQVAESQHISEGQAVGPMFAGLTLANVPGVTGGAWIGNMFGWNTTFIVAAMLGAMAVAAIAVAIPSQGAEKLKSIRSQIGAVGNPQLLASLSITTLGWVGFMTFCGYIAPIAEQVAGFERSSLTWILVIVGLGLVLGNTLGGKTADKNLSASLIGWPAGMIASLIVVGLVASPSSFGRSGNLRLSPSTPDQERILI